MAVKIYSAPQGGIMSSKIGKVGLGFAVGGPVGAGVALLGASNPSLGAIANAAGIGSKSEDSSEDLQAGPVQQIEGATKGTSPTNAIDRRYNALSQDPKMSIVAGLDALKDPSVPQSLRDAYAEPLLRAKYGKGMA